MPRAYAWAHVRGVLPACAAGEVVAVCCGGGGGNGSGRARAQEADRNKQLELGIHATILLRQQ